MKLKHFVTAFILFQEIRLEIGSTGYNRSAGPCVFSANSLQIGQSVPSPKKCHNSLEKPKKENEGEEDSHESTQASYVRLRPSKESRSSGVDDSLCLCRFGSVRSYILFGTFKFSFQISRFFPSRLRSFLNTQIFVFFYPEHKPVMNFL